MGETIVEKILGRTSGRKVVPGDIAVCRPDMVVQLDMPYSIDGFWYKPKQVFDPDRVALVFDHAVPAPTIKDASGMAEGRRFAKEFGLKHVYDVGRHGISHVISAEYGLARPGELIVNCDSHTCASGALNCAGRGSGALDALQAMTQGLVWYPVSPTVRYEFKGTLNPFVAGKDVLFHIAQTYGSHVNQNVEFGGRGLLALPMNDRRTIATMCAEIGADFAVFEYDAITEEYLRGRLDRPATPVAPDADASYVDVRTIDLSALEPYVVKPHHVPGNAVRVSQFNQTKKIDQAFVGSCANGLIEDIRIAAAIMRGRQVADGVRFIVTPGSQSVYLQALKEGLVEILTEAGAVVTNSTCGPCMGVHMGILAPGEVCLTSSTRNFKGRMGSSEAEVYLGASATVAASALTGVITDPRPYAGTMANLPKVAS